MPVKGIKIVCALAAVLTLLGPDRPLHAVSPLPGSVTLSHIPPDYDWWNGCAPTAAGMLFAWWDEMGYPVFPGDPRNLPATYDGTSSNPADYTDARGVIASWEHKLAGGGLTYGSYKNHAPNSIADFILTYNSSTQPSALAHGFETFGAWDAPSTARIEGQRFTASTSYTSGDWTYQKYVDEINAGRPVYLGWTSGSSQHATLGIGYNNTGGKQDVIVLTTWHSGEQEWEWTNEQSQYSVASGTTMQPISGAHPPLSGYFSIARGYTYDLNVELGVGDPLNPTWKTIVWNHQGGQDNNLVLTDLDCTPIMADFRTKNLQWYLKVSQEYPQFPGTIQDFQIRYGFDQLDFKMTGAPVTIPDSGAGYVYLNTTPFSVSSAWQGSGTSPGSWGNFYSWDHGTPEYLNDTAAFGNSIGGASAAVVTLDGNRTISSLSINNALGGSYKIQQGTGGSLTLSNGGNPVPVTVAAGSHSIEAPVSLNSDVTVDTAHSAALNISGIITGIGMSLTKTGDGALTLAAANNLTGNTTVNGGTLIYDISSGSPVIGAGSALNIAAGATVNVESLVDPFTSGANHISVVNHGSTGFNAIGPGVYEVASISGSDGITSVGNGATLIAGSIWQDTLSLSGGSMVILQSTGAGSGAIQGNVGGSSSVPEPASWIHLIFALAAIGCWRLFSQ
jgi:autotransporter-associated beta strand protein